MHGLKQQFTSDWWSLNTTPVQHKEDATPYSNELPYEYMLALRESDEATSWQPFVRPDPWLSHTMTSPMMFQC